MVPNDLEAVGNHSAGNLSSKAGNRDPFRSQRSQVVVPDFPTPNLASQVDEILVLSNFYDQLQTGKNRSYFIEPLRRCRCKRR